MADKIEIEKNGKIVVQAEYSGFCHGVSQAIQKAEQTAERYGKEGRKVYTFGEIIHNDDAVNDLKARGVEVCDQIEAVEKEAVLIIRSHGVGKETENTLRQSCFQLVDATCPHVKRIHQLAEKAHQQGKTVVIIGDENHHEVIGINGWCENQAVIFGSPQDILKPESEERLKSADDIYVVAQTTLNQRAWNQCAALLQEKYPRSELVCTICRATINRQSACRRVAETSDLMVVIGGRNSSNSKKLFEIASEACKKTFFVENSAGLPAEELKKHNKIGVSAGASAPKRIISEVISEIEKIIG